MPAAGNTITSGARVMRVAFVWNGTVHDERLVSLGESVVVGDGPQALFPIPEGAGTTEESITLLDGGASAHQLHLDAAMGGDVWVRGQRTDVRDLMRVSRVVELGPDDFGIVTLGPVAYFFQYVKGPPRLAGMRTRVDYAILACILLSAFGHAVLAMLGMLTRHELPPEDELSLSPTLVTRFLVFPPPDEPPPPTPQEQASPQHDEPSDKRAPSKASRRPDPDRRATASRDRSTESSVSAVTKLLRAGPQGPTLSHVMSSTQFARGSPTGASGLSNLLSTLPGGTINVGTPGGTAAITTLSGTQATVGVNNLQRRAGSGQVRGRVSSIAALARTTGSGLTRGEILEVINRYQGRIQQCYERALNRNGALAGRMTFDWQVTTSGATSNVRQRDSTLGDNGVTTCIIGVIRGMRFPRPTGGSVDVSFPFLFRRAE